MIDINSIKNELFYSVEELSGLLQRHPQSIKNWLREGKLKGIKVGRPWMIKGEELKKFFKEGLR